MKKECYLSFMRGLLNPFFLAIGMLIGAFIIYTNFMLKVLLYLMMAVAVIGFVYYINLEVDKAGND